MSHPHVNFIIIVLGGWRTGGGGIKKLKISSKTMKMKKYLNDIFIYLEDPFFDICQDFLRCGRILEKLLAFRRTLFLRCERFLQKLLAFRRTSDIK